MPPTTNLQKIPLKRAETLIQKSRTRNNDEIHRGKLVLVEAKELPKDPLHPVPSNRLAHLAVDNETQTRMP